MLKKILILAIILAVGLWYWHNLNSSGYSNAATLPFIVSQGETIRQVAEKLQKEKFIKSAFYFKYIIWRGHLTVKAGEYSISPSFSAKEIAKILTSGEALSQEISIRIIEGWNNKDIGAYLDKENIVISKDFLALAKTPLKEWRFRFARPDFLNDAPQAAGLEGYLFPDTYRIYQDATAEDIFFKMLDNFNKKLTPEMRQEIKRQKKTIYEIVTMASVIEKEVRTSEDMKIVSGIFWDRIKHGQALESCATLAYVLGVNKTQYTYEDTKINSPYNTYKYRGLPPGPIANPGLNAVKAAIYPENTEYNYFLSDPATGKTVYGKTLDEHNYNKAKFLK
jgi:UPF0755 protein